MNDSWLEMFELLDHGPNMASAYCPLVGMCDDETCCTDDFNWVWDEDLVQPCPDLILAAPSVSMPWAKNAQFGPHVQQKNCIRLFTDDPPCPCDRWCGDSDEESLAASLRSCASPASDRGAKFKAVSFDTTVDIFGFDPDSSADALPEEWWTVDDESIGSLVEDTLPLQQSSPSLQVKDGSDCDPFQAFWKEWCSLWLPLQNLCASNGPKQYWDCCLGRFDDIPKGTCEHIGLWKEHRNEGGLAAGVQDPRLTDPRAYVPELPEDDSDDDLGVAFFRWIDVLSLTDLHPYRRGGSIPFIT